MSYALQTCPTTTSFACLSTSRSAATCSSPATSEKGTPRAWLACPRAAARALLAAAAGHMQQRRSGGGGLRRIVAWAAPRAPRRPAVMRLLTAHTSPALHAHGCNVDCNLSSVRASRARGGAMMEILDHAADTSFAFRPASSEKRYDGLITKNKKNIVNMQASQARAGLCKASIAGDVSGARGARAACRARVQRSRRCVAQRAELRPYAQCGATQSVDVASSIRTAALSVLLSAGALLSPLQAFAEV